MVLAATTAENLIIDRVTADLIIKSDVMFVMNMDIRANYATKIIITRIMARKTAPIGTILVNLGIYYLLFI